MKIEPKFGSRDVFLITILYLSTNVSKLWQLFFEASQLSHIKSVNKWRVKTSRLFRKVSIILCARCDYVMRGWCYLKEKSTQRLVWSTVSDFSRTFWRNQPNTRVFCPKWETKSSLLHPLVLSHTWSTWERNSVCPERFPLPSLPVAFCTLSPALKIAQLFQYKPELHVRWRSTKRIKSRILLSIGHF